MKVCSQPGCPTLHSNRAGRCSEHERARDAARGSRQARGYDARHLRLRSEWAIKIATGTVRCWRCGEVVHPAERWDLGHDDDDRTVHRGPEHADRCNRSAAGRKSHQ